MKISVNWSKVFLNFYPADIVKQFKRVSIPLYLSFSLVFIYVIMNFKELFLSKNFSLEIIFAFYFILPILLPFTAFGLLLSSFHIARNHNPFLLYCLNFKHLLIYGFNFGMIVFSSLFLLIYFIFINQVFKIL